MSVSWNLELLVGEEDKVLDDLIAPKCHLVLNHARMFR